MASNYRPNGLSAPRSFCQILGGPKLTRNGHFAIQPIALLFPLRVAVSLLSDWRKYLNLSLIPSNGFWTLLLLSIWMGFESDVMGLLWTHLEWILDVYFKCVGCTFSMWAWIGSRLIVWVSSVHIFRIRNGEEREEKDPDPDPWRSYEVPRWRMTYCHVSNFLSPMPSSLSLQVHVNGFKTSKN